MKWSAVSERMGEKNERAACIEAEQAVIFTLFQCIFNIYLIEPYGRSECGGSTLLVRWHRSAHRKCIRISFIHRIFFIALQYMMHHGPAPPPTLVAVFISSENLNGSWSCLVCSFHLLLLCIMRVCLAMHGTSTRKFVVYEMNVHRTCIDHRATSCLCAHTINLLSLLDNGQDL